MNYPEEFLYTKEHEWIRIENDEAVVGITHYAQEQLGDIVYLELPEIGERFNAMDVFGTIESVKTASDLYLPASGEIIAVNREVIDHPEIVNSSPHDKGWMVRMRLTSRNDIQNLLTAKDYQDYLETLP